MRDSFLYYEPSVKHMRGVRPMRSALHSLETAIGFYKVMLLGRRGWIKRVSVKGVTAWKAGTSVVR